MLVPGESCCWGSRRAVSPERSGSCVNAQRTPVRTSDPDRENFMLNTFCPALTIDLFHQTQAPRGGITEVRGGRLPSETQQRQQAAERALQRPQSSEFPCDVLEDKFSMFKVMKKGQSERERGRRGKLTIYKAGGRSHARFRCNR